MAIFNWTTQASGSTIVFNPLADQFVIDDGNIYAANLEAFGGLSNTGPTLVFTYGDKNVTLLVDPRAITTSNVTFVNGSQLIIGDNTTGTANDDLNNVLTSTGDGDHLAGMGGNDRIVDTSGNDFLEGNDGTQDTVDYSGAAGGVTVDLAMGTAIGSAGNDTLSGIEYVWGSDSGDTLIGNDQRNFLRGNGGDDIIDGGGQSEIEFGQDDRQGDYVDYFGASGPVEVDLAAGTATGADGNDTLTEIESVRGSSHADTLIGNSGMNFLRGGEGDDDLDGGDGVDFADYRDATDGMVVNLADGTSSGPDGNDDLSNIEGIRGSDFNDMLIGNDGDNFFYGRPGDDDITGGVGFDFLLYRGASGGVSVALSSGGASGADGNDTFTGIEGVEGSDFNDTLTGANGEDSMLLGFAGNDVLFATTGEDSLNGGVGSDSIDFEVTGIGYGGDVGVSVNLADGHVDLDGVAGTDTWLQSIEFVRGTVGRDIMTGGDEEHRRDTGQGNTISEIFRGNGGNDTITGGEWEAAADDLVALSGFFTIADYSNNSSTEHVVANLFEGGASDGKGGTDELSHVDSLRGGQGNDTLLGGSLSRTGSGTFFEVLRGNAGNDVLNGNNVHSDGGDASGDRADYANNGSANPIIVNMTTGLVNDGLGGTDTLIGIDQVYGGAGNDTFFGGSANDAFDGGAGNDTLNGGAGADEARFQQSSAGVIANLSGAAINVGGFAVASNRAYDGMGGFDILSSIENLRGSDFNDHLRGSDNTGTRQTFQGDAGNDYIDGGAGIDFASYSAVALTLGGITAFIENGAGTVNDRMGGNDTLVNIEGLQGTNSNDILTGGEGEQWFRGRGGNDQIDGGAGDDWVSYSNDPTGVEVMLGDGETAGSATDGWNGPTGLLDLGGTDTLTSIENIEGSIFDDQLVGNDEDNEILGRDGDDYLGGSAGNDVLDGGAGNDTLAGNLGDDNLNGGAGNQDAADYGDAAGPVTVDLAAGTATGEGNDTLTGIEYVWGTSGNDIIVGDNTRNFISGGEGDDILDGREHFNIGLGRDARAGDYADYQSASGEVTVDLGAGTATGADGNDTLSNFESVRGSGGNDTLIGDGGTNFLRGMGGDDDLDGGAGIDFADYREATNSVTVDLASNTATGADGNDTLESIEGAQGGDFDDTLIGSSGDNIFQGRDGNDTMHGGTGSDIVSFRFAGSVTVNLGTGVATGEGNDTFTGIEGIEGSDFADNFTGTSAVNIIRGFAGSDFFNASTGADTLDGGTDSDTVDMNATGIAYGGGIGVNVNLATGVADFDTSAAGANITIIGIEQVRGTAGNDVLTGGSPTNLRDGLGNSFTEVLRGRGGNDIITGRGGANVVQLSEYSTAADYADNSNTQHVSANLHTGIVTDGRGGTDTLGHVDHLRGGSGNDLLVGGSLSRGSTGTFFEILRGNAGNDTLNGNNGFSGGIDASGDRADYANNLANEGIVASFVTNTVQDGRGGTDTLIDIDQIYGGAGNDSFTGGAANDAFDGGAGSDVMDGGAGSDTARFNQSTAGVIVNLSAASIMVNGITVGSNRANDGMGSTDTLNNIESVRGSDFNDHIRGSDLNVRQFLDGEAGDDFIDGGGGGIDFASYASLAIKLGGISAFIENGAGTVEDGTGGEDELVNIEGLQGTSSADELSGGAGDQWFRGRGGSDSINGGAGIDWVSYAADPSGVIANLTTGTATDGWNGIGGLLALGGTDTLLNIENIEGSDYNDSLSGNGGANAIDARDGNDVLNGLAGNDALTAGAGNDTLDGGAGNDLLNGGEGTDRASYLSAAAGVSVNLAVLTAQNTVGAGNDTLGSIEHLTGSAHNDQLTGNTGNNQLLGSAGNDTLIGGAGNDTLDGGTGVDTAFYLDAVAGVTVSLALAGAQNTVGAGTDTLSVIENLLGSALNDTLTGNAQINDLRGGAGNDILRGLEGNDVIDGGAGDDTLEGGVGNDTLNGGLSGTDTATYFNATAGVSVSLLLGGAQNTFGAGIDTLAAIDHLTGSAHVDVLIGNALANVINGGGGIDELRGEGGNDTLLGGDGNDSLLGGLGNDILNGGAGVDTASYFTSTAGVSVSLLLPGAQNTLGAGIDTLIGIENLIGSNSSFIDTLTGNAVANFLRGFNGNDTLRGGDGNDSLQGDAGNDRLEGGNGIDTALYLQAAGGVTVNLAVAAAQNTVGAGIDTLIGMENATGSGFVDNLIGSAGANALNGSNGNDVLRGAGGADSLTGGLGADRFDYDALIDSGVTAGTRDVIQDFLRAQLDKIDLSTIDANAALAGNQAFTFIGGAAFAGNSAGRLRFDAANNLVLGSTDADTAAEFSIQVNGLGSMLASDFIL